MQVTTLDDVISTQECFSGKVANKDVYLPRNVLSLAAESSTAPRDLVKTIIESQPGVNPVKLFAARCPGDAGAGQQGREEEQVSPLACALAKRNMGAAKVRGCTCPVLYAVTHMYCLASYKVPSS